MSRLNIAVLLATMAVLGVAGGSCPGQGQSPLFVQQQFACDVLCEGQPTDTINLNASDAQEAMTTCQNRVANDAPEIQAVCGLAPASCGSCSATGM